MGVRLVIYNPYTNSLGTFGGGTYNHNELLERDSLDQHPIYSITGLQEILNTIEDDLLSISNIISGHSNDIRNINAEINNIHSILDNSSIETVVDTNTIDLSYQNKTLTADVKVYDDNEKSNSIIKTDNGLYSPKLVTKETQTITWGDVSIGETPFEIFKNGIRFSHNDTDTYNNLIIPEDTDGWNFNADTNSLIQPIQSTSFNGIVSNSVYNNYKHSVRIKSTSEDENINGIVIAFIFDEFNKPHTLSAIVQRSGLIYINYKFALIYNFRLPGEEVIDSYNLIDSDDGWDTSENGITFISTKRNNLISVSVSGWNYDNTIDSIDNIDSVPKEKTFSINLNNFSWGRYFIDKVRYGYANMSQSQSYFDHILFYSNNMGSPLSVFANVRLDENENNAIEKRQDGLFVEKFLISEEIDNAIEKKEDGYFVKTNPMLISEKRLNGLVYLGSNYYYIHKSHSFIEVTQQSHDLIIGDFIYYDNRTNLYKKAIAIDSYDINIVGMVYYTEENYFEYVCNGFIETDLFTTENGFVQGMPLYISDVEPGKVIQEQPDISKAVGYPIEDIGIIISIERGIQYTAESRIGDIKKSANNYNIRSDGFIKIDSTVNYKLSVVNKLFDNISEEFIENYIVIDEENNEMRFKNTEILYKNNDVTEEGINLFIKAF